MTARRSARLTSTPSADGGRRATGLLARRTAGALGHRSIIAVRPGEPLAASRRRRARDVPLSPFAEMDVLAALRLRRAIVDEMRTSCTRTTGHAVALAALATMGTRARMVLTRRVSFPLKRNPASLWKYARADAIIAVCQATADALVASGIESARITVAYSGVDLTRVIPPASPETLASLGVKRRAAGGDGRCARWPQGSAYVRARDGGRAAPCRTCRR